MGLVTGMRGAGAEDPAVGDELAAYGPTIRDRGAGSRKVWAGRSRTMSRELAAAMRALASVKSPPEFMELQQRLIREGVEAAVTDGQHIAQLTTAVFNAAFEPPKNQIEGMHKSSRP